MNAVESLRIEPEENRVRVDDEAAQGEGFDGKAVEGAAGGHGADFGFLDGGFVEVFAEADGAVEGAGAHVAAVFIRTGLW